MYLLYEVGIVMARLLARRTAASQVSNRPA
jgi:Sec-independent protein secretion pathway component TatC